LYPSGKASFNVSVILGLWWGYSLLLALL
jgi:hypothetical protein